MLCFFTLFLFLLLSIHVPLLDTLTHFFFLTFMLFFSYSNVAVRSYANSHGWPNIPNKLPYISLLASRPQTSLLAFFT